MPVGRPRLKPEVKAQHVQESRKRYEDQQVSNLNADKRREAARLRMQRKRAAIEVSDFHTRRKYREKVAVNSEIYRARSPPFAPLSTAPSSPSTLTASAPSRTPSPPALADDAQIAAMDIALEKAPSAAPSASKLSLRERQAQRNAKYNSYLEAEDARLAADAAAQKKKEELAYLASTRGSASPERMRQQFARVLGPVSVLEWPPPDPSDSSVAQGLGGEPDPVLLNPLGQMQACQQRLVMPTALPTENCDGEDVERGWGKAPVMYAVSGRNRVFRDRERAMAALRESPGAELVFTRDEVELFQFLEDFDKKFKI
ncbi:hypothetical protein DFH07DRAFT_773275 [Mycena maculata]|uniref:Uncharacterized protein n=1 Tax=Mycena maculata TaxID=230809 RepID=A0AAD7NDU7_9AGAR|nr:hypothetical protein DFH07DRAFT_773275 [Mycena maculata]